MGDPIAFTLRQLQIATDEARDLADVRDRNQFAVYERKLRSMPVSLVSIPAFAAHARITPAAARKAILRARAAGIIEKAGTYRAPKRRPHVVYQLTAEFQAYSVAKRKPRSA